MSLSSFPTNGNLKTDPPLYDKLIECYTLEVMDRVTENLVHVALNIWYYCGGGFFNAVDNWYKRYPRLNYEFEFHVTSLFCGWQVWFV